MELFAVFIIGTDDETKKWVTVYADTSRQAVEGVKGIYPGYTPVRCFKEVPEWKWR